MGDVIVDRDDGVWIVTLTGEHDLSNVSELRAILDSVLAPVSRPLLVVVDLTDAEFFDSSVINAIVRARDATDQDPDADLAVVVDSPASIAGRLLNLLGLTRIIPTYTSREAAVAALADRSDSKDDQSQSRTLIRGSAGGRAGNDDRDDHRS
jgi:anti-anti-sigma factor